MNGTQELADDILKDIFSDQDSLSHRRTYQAKKRKNSVRLVSLTDENNGNSSKYSNSNDHRLNSANNLRHSETSLHGNSSTYSGNSYSPSSNNSNVYSAGHSNTNSSTLSQLNTKNKLKPINHNDHHVVSDIIHRVTNVSGQSPEKKINVANSGASVASSVANNKNIALDSSITNSLNTIITTNHSDNSCDTVTVNNVNEVQRKTLQESSTVKSVMKKVVKLHQDLDAIVHDSLQHRKELASAIDTINKAYITNFEAMLRELLHTQRTKFKVITISIDCSTCLYLLSTTILSDTKVLLTICFYYYNSYCFIYDPNL